MMRVIRQAIEFHLEDTYSGWGWRGIYWGMANVGSHEYYTSRSSAWRGLKRFLRRLHIDESHWVVDQEARIITIK